MNITSKRQLLTIQQLLCSNSVAKQNIFETVDSVIKITKNWKDFIEIRETNPRKIESCWNRQTLE